MKIIIAKESGFCFGVKRASDMAISAAKSCKKIQTLGPLIHNPEYIKYVKKYNINIIDNLDKITAEKIVIRSHGITKYLEKKIREKEKEIIDATCPFVKRVQKMAEELEKSSYKVLILGKKSHPEVLGIKSYAPKSHIVKDIKDIPAFKKEDKVALISQTTQNIKTFEEIAKFLKEKYKNLKIFNTICDATEKRQGEARQLAQKVDIMIIIGGRDSSNTTRLKEVCESFVETYHIENESELKRQWFLGKKTAGITAGASTPDFSISAVVKKIKKYDKNTKTYSHHNGRKQKMGKKKRT